MRVEAPVVRLADEWAVVQLHAGPMRAGRIRDVERFGSRWLRMDMPVGDMVLTELFSAGVVEAVRLVGPARAREVADAILLEAPELGQQAVHPELTEKDLPF